MPEDTNSKPYTVFQGAYSTEQNERVGYFLSREFKDFTAASLQSILENFKGRISVYLGSLKGHADLAVLTVSSNNIRRGNGSSSEGRIADSQKHLSSHRLPARF